MAKEFKIPFVGLTLGTHYYDYLITDAFFEKLDYSLIRKGNIVVNLELLKQESMLILGFTIDGVIIEACDTCLAEIEVPIKGKNRLIVKLSEEEFDADDDEVVVINKHEFELDVAQYIYEFISLLRPLKIEPPEDCEEQGLCDMEVKRKLIGDEGEEGIADDNVTEDPRWNALKDLFNKKEK